MAPIAPQVIGPRHSFLVKKSLLFHDAVSGGVEGGLDWAAVLQPSDAAFCEALGASANEFEGHRNMFEVRPGLVDSNHLFENF